MKEEQLEAIIAQAIGQEEAQKAVEAVLREWGGMLQMIPTGDDGRRAARNREMRRLYRTGGLGISAIATRFRVSETTVRRVVGD